MSFDFIRKGLRIYTFNLFEGRYYNLCEKLDTRCASLNEEAWDIC